MSGSTRHRVGRAAPAGLVLAAVVAAGAGHAQVSQVSPGIAAVPSPATPPPVVTQSVPSSVPLPQTSQGGRIAPFPNADPPAPVSTPGVTPLPGSLPANRSTVTGSQTGAAATRSGPVDPSGSGRPTGSPLPPPPVAAGGMDIVTAYDLGEHNDATWKSALAERDANRQVADQSIAGFLPTAGYSYQNIPTETGSRHVVTVTQPVVSFGALATFRQRKPRRGFANATLQVRAQDLATRLMTAVADIIKSTEASILNDARIDSLRVQSERAERLYKRGLGTITDARDIEVRYEQALANRVLMKSDQLAAEARMRSITGVPTPENAFALPATLGPIILASVDTYLAQQEKDNPAIEAARDNERISKLESDRIRGSFLPTVGVSATYSRYQGVSDSYVGLSVNAPLNGSTFFMAGAARATARRSVEDRRQVEEKARTELSRLHALIDGGREALAINAKAIEAAKLSVEANTKSYEGGVRTNVDVVNAIQTQFEVQNAYVQSATALATNYLSLLLLSGEDPADALAAVQKFLLAR